MMKHLSYGVNQLSNLTYRFCLLGLLITGSAMSIAILLQIIFRFVIYVPFPWSEEFARYLMIWMGMLGSVVALRQGRHIGVTVLIEYLPDRLFRAILLLTRLVMIAFLVVVAKEGWLLAVFNADQHSPSMEIPMFYPYLAISAGAALMIVELVAGVLNECCPTPAGGQRKMIAKSL